MPNSLISLTSKIIAYEEGRLDYEEEIELFRGLMRTGVIHSLQGSYHRRMNELIEGGFVTP